MPDLTPEEAMWALQQRPDPWPNTSKNWGDVYNDASDFLKKLPGRAGAAGVGALNTMTMGAGPGMAGAVGRAGMYSDPVPDEIANMDPSQRKAMGDQAYDSAHDATKGFIQNTYSQHPTASKAGEVAGFMAMPGASGVKGAMKGWMGPGMGEAALKGARQGAAIGGVRAYNDFDDEMQAKHPDVTPMGAAAISAAVNAPFGAIGGAIGNKIGDSAGPALQKMMKRGEPAEVYPSRFNSWLGSRQYNKEGGNYTPETPNAPNWLNPGPVDPVVAGRPPGMGGKFDPRLAKQPNDIMDLTPENGAYPLHGSGIVPTKMPQSAIQALLSQQARGGRPPGLNADVLPFPQGGRGTPGIPGQGGEVVPFPMGWLGPPRGQ